MSAVRDDSQDVSISVDESVSPLSQHCHPHTEVRSDLERESPSPPQPAANVLPDIIPSDECSQTPTSTNRVASSQQPSAEFLRSIGIRVRDFAYESTLPAVISVPRVPRQIQPGPDSLKRSERAGDDKEDRSIGLSREEASSEERESKKPRLERTPTEPVEELVTRPVRTLRRTLTVKRVRSIVNPSSRGTFPMTTRTRFSTSPPTSPLTPLSHVESQESEVVQTPPSFPFVVRVDGSSMIAAPRSDPESQPLSLHPIIYARIHSSTTCSPVPSSQQVTSPAPLRRPLRERSSPVKEPGTDVQVRKRRGRGSVGVTPVTNRYQLRQRPIAHSRASIPSGSGSLPRRTRRGARS